MIKILKIVGFAPSSMIPQSIVVSDVSTPNPQRQFIVHTGVTQEWRDKFERDPGNYIGKRAIIQTLPPVDYKPRFPVFMGVANLERIDQIVPAVNYDYIELPNGTSLKVEAPIQAYLGSTELLLEIADTPEKASRGYMFRPKIPDGHGMIFTKLEPGSFVFWMKNTHVPLDLIFVDETMRVSEVIYNMQPRSEKLQVNKTPAVFAIEVPAGSITPPTIGDLLSY